MLSVHVSYCQAEKQEFGKWHEINMSSNQCQCFAFTLGLHAWVEHSESLLCVSLNKQEGIWCLLLLLANTVAATVITAIRTTAINNSTVHAITVCVVTYAKYPSRAGETIKEN